MHCHFWSPWRKWQPVWELEVGRNSAGLRPEECHLLKRDVEPWRTGRKLRWLESWPTRTRSDSVSSPRWRRGALGKPPGGACQGVIWDMFYGDSTGYVYIHLSIFSLIWVSCSIWEDQWKISASYTSLFAKSALFHHIEKGFRNLWSVVCSSI